MNDLAPPPFPFVRWVIHLEEVGSTNDHARELLATGNLETPALIWADRQTRGRGQRSNTWWSDDGSLTASVVLDPSSHGLTIDREPRVALAVAVAIVAAIAELYPTCPAGIRWPNDVEADGRKLGGILSERVETFGGPRLIVGFGVNVRARLDQAPEPVARMAATLTEWRQVPEWDEPITGLLAAILGHLPETLAQLANDDPSLPEAWANLDTLAGSTVRVEVAGEVFEAQVLGIEPDGGLRLIHDGRVKTIHAGRILREEFWK